jgi:ABC-type Mn2+/Zn2+ transport system ATPase subunit
MVRADGLTVARGRRVLLRDFSLELGSGEMLHVVGPNGCGKSSLLRVLAGVVEPRRGRVRRAAPCVYVPERIALSDSLPARRWLRVTGAADTPLSEDLDRRCGALSKGQLQRVALAGAFSERRGRPCVFVLDEPWAGLDAPARAALGAEIGTLAQDGSTVVYTDHSGAATIAPTRTLQLGEVTPEVDDRPGVESARVRIELSRGDDRVSVTVNDADFAARLAEGWKIERGEPLP